MVEKWAASQSPGRHARERPRPSLLRASRVKPTLARARPSWASHREAVPAEAPDKDRKGAHPGLSIGVGPSSDTTACHPQIKYAAHTHTPREAPRIRTWIDCTLRLGAPRSRTPERGVRNPEPTGNQSYHPPRPQQSVLIHIQSGNTDSPEAAGSFTPGLSAEEVGPSLLLGDQKPHYHRGQSMVHIRMGVRHRPTSANSRRREG